MGTRLGKFMFVTTNMDEHKSACMDVYNGRLIGYGPYNFELISMCKTTELKDWWQS